MSGLGEVESRKVRVELFGVPRLRAGVGEIELEAGTVREAMAGLARLCPALDGTVVVDGVVHPAYRLNLNGERFLRAEDGDERLSAGDSLLLIAADVGG